MSLSWSKAIVEDMFSGVSPTWSMACPWHPSLRPESRLGPKAPRPHRRVLLAAGCCRKRACSVRLVRRPAPQTRMPHPNACLTCPDFQTTVQFLPAHKRQAEEAVKLIEAASSAGYDRGVTNHRPRAGQFGEDHFGLGGPGASWQRRWLTGPSGSDKSPRRATEPPWPRRSKCPQFSDVTAIWSVSATWPKPPASLGHGSTVNPNFVGKSSD